MSSVLVPVSFRMVVTVNEDDRIDYLLDTASLREIQEDPGWREEAQQRIEDIRMGDVTVEYACAILLVENTMAMH